MSYIEINSKEQIEYGHFGQIVGHFGQTNGHYVYDLVLDTTVGMSLRDSLGYNLLLIIVDRYRKQTISSYLVVITIMIKNRNTLQGYRMVLIEMAFIMEVNIVKWL